MTAKAYRYVGYMFGCDDDNCVQVVHAETRNQARQMIAGDTGQDYLDVTVHRCPSMDDLPATDFYLLAMGLVDWYECHGCYRQIHEDASSGSDIQEWPHAKDASPYAYLYPEDDQDDDFPAIKGEEPPEGDVISRPVHAEGIGMFCSESCYDKWHGSKAWRQLRKLRGLDREAIAEPSQEPPA